MSVSWTAEELYDAGCAAFHPPPVYTGFWEKADWVRWCSRWFCYAVWRVGSFPEGVLTVEERLASIKPSDDFRTLDRAAAQAHAEALTAEHGTPFEVITVNVTPSDR